jgi:hypothetical protein
LLELDRYTYHGSHIRAEFCLRSDRSPVPNTSSGSASSIFSAALAGAWPVQACSDYASEIRKELAEIAQKRDRAALAERVAANFFWIPEARDLADKQRPGIDNLAKALGLDAPDGVGWDTIAAYAGEASTAADPQRSGVICSPAEAGFEEAAADVLANATQTDATDWVFPIRDGVEVRSGARQDATVIETLGLHLVRVIPDESPANAVLSVIKVLTPSGKVGFVPLESVLPIGGEQMCYVKEASGWKIAGFLGGEANQ